ncbi:MAG TPA: hypothetical protein VMW68_00370 [Methyloceanibacter sp.]|nr:hypothetical protein [Methyloceanibacter sp.]
MWLLVGAGGHAKAVVEALEAGDIEIDAYVDLMAKDWPAARHIPSDEAALLLKKGNVVIGMGGVTGADLSRRLALLRRYRDAGWAAPAVVHPAATVSRRAKLGPGTIILAGAVVQPGALIDEGAIVNTCAIVEHDSRIGAGVHIAPGATVLGGCGVGEAAMVGAGAVVLPGAIVPEEGLVPALMRYPK